MDVEFGIKPKNRPLFFTCFWIFYLGKVTCLAPDQRQAVMVRIQGKVFQHQKLRSSYSSILLGEFVNVKINRIKLKRFFFKPAKAP